MALSGSLPSLPDQRQITAGWPHCTSRCFATPIFPRSLVFRFTSGDIYQSGAIKNPGNERGSPRPHNAIAPELAADQYHNYMFLRLLGWPAIWATHGECVRWRQQLFSTNKSPDTHSTHSQRWDNGANRLKPFSCPKRVGRSVLALARIGRRLDASALGSQCPPYFLAGLRATSRLLPRSPPPFQTWTCERIGCLDCRSPPPLIDLDPGALAVFCPGKASATRSGAPMASIWDSLGCGRWPFFRPPGKGVGRHSGQGESGRPASNRDYLTNNGVLVIQGYGVSGMDACPVGSGTVVKKGYRRTCRSVWPFLE